MSLELLNLLTKSHDIFLSYSRTDDEAADKLHGWLKSRGFSVFFDKKEIHEGELWLDRLQKAIDHCGVFMVLIGDKGVERWVGAETQVALSRYFGPHDDANRLPIFPILLSDAAPDTLPVFLRLFQTTPWNGSDPLSDTLLDQIRNRSITTNKTLVFKGKPFVGLSAYRVDQAPLFFGRQRQTLDALCFFGPRTGLAAVRWLEISGSSGSGKSSLMNAGLLPLIDHGWLFSRTGYSHWLRIGPKTSGEHSMVAAMVPGQKPLSMLSEQLAVTFGAEMSDVRQRLEHGDNNALAEWLRSRKRDDTAFLLAIDQFEELFTFADAAERKQFDKLLAAALADADCPLYIISTVRVDFLDRFEADLPHLNHQRARIGNTWPLPQLNADGLREIIDGPARLANIDVSEVKEMMIAQAYGEPGALPLIENALDWLWEKSKKNPHSDTLQLNGKLFTDEGGLAGILKKSADDLIASLGKNRERVLHLLFHLVKVDTEGHRHARRSIPLAEAIAIAGGGEHGRELVDQLAGRRARDGAKHQGPLRLITVTDDASVNLIHETLIRSKGNNEDGEQLPYWPTLWSHIEQRKEQAKQRERLELLVRQWKPRKRMKRLFGLVGWWDLINFWKLSAPGSLERTYLRWSAAVASTTALILALIIWTLGESAWWAQQHNFPPAYILHKPQWMLGNIPEPELVEIPAGQFTMGCLVGRDDIDGDCPNHETPTREVTIAKLFLMGKYEVTFIEYDAFVWHMRKNSKNDGSEFEYAQNEGWGRLNRPVINVSWHDAQAYAKWLGEQTDKICRLPTEAEWEYAARGGTPTAYHWGNELGKNNANCYGCGSIWDGKKTAPVGSFPANPYGLHDMSGNVWEWVEDAYGDYPKQPTGAEALTVNDSEFRVLRGGSWGDSPDYLRASGRDGTRPVNRGNPVGFRV